MVFYIAALIMCILLYILYRSNKNYWKNRNVPFEPPLPLIGNLWDTILLRKTLGIVISDLYKKYSNEPFFGMWMFNVPHLVIRSPDLIRHILIKDFDNFTDRTVDSNESVDAITANMMFFTRNPKWKRIRTITSPLFSSGKLRYIFPQIQITAKNMISFIKAKNAQPLDMRPLSAKFATDNICSIAFGIDAHSFKDEKAGFTTFGIKVHELTLRNAIIAATYFCRNPVGNMLRLKFIPTLQANFLTDTCLNVLKERESKSSGRNDLIDLMIELKNQHNLKDYEVVAYAAQFFVAGYETTTSTIAYSLYELAFNKNIQDVLRVEVNAIKEDDENSLYNFLNDSKTYIHKVMLETLRKYSVVLFLGRDCNKDYKIPDSDVVIERGTPVIISLMGLHYDPKYFPDPEKYDPERFSEENIRERHPCVHMPFGEGQRHCIGKRLGALSVKMALFNVIKNFEVEPSADTNYPLKISAKSFSFQTNPFYLVFKDIN